MHAAATPTPPPRRRSSRHRSTTTRGAEAPSGWPIAIAPPLTLTSSRSTSGSPSQRRQHHRGERLVDLPQVDVRGAPARSARARWSIAGTGATAEAVRLDGDGRRRRRSGRAARRRAPRRRARVADQIAVSAVVDRRGVAGRDRAVRGEGRLQRGQRSRPCCPGAATRPAARRRPSRTKPSCSPSLVRGRDPLVRSDRPRVLRRPGRCRARRRPAPRRHRASRSSGAGNFGLTIRQPTCGLDAAASLRGSASSGFWQHVRRPAHPLDAAGDARARRHRSRPRDRPG